MSRNGGQSLIKFRYNADGIRTNKIVNGANHVYTLNGTQIVSEAWGNFLLIYLYDESGAPIGLQYRTKSYAANVFDTFYFEKNLQGDIIAVYNADGDRIGSYIYDAWGNFTVTVESTSTTLEKNIVRSYNPFRYRGYYYDTETGLYYLQSRYYNPAWGRFLNADGLISTGRGLLGYNMYAYCNNNPVMYVDRFGMCPGCNCPSCMSGLPDECACASTVGTSASKTFMEQYEDYLAATYKPPTAEEKVQNARHFAFYKGKLVIKIDKICEWFYNGEPQGMSFGVIFIASDHDDFAQVLKHEYGHTIQFDLLGPVVYLFGVGIPSLYDYFTIKDSDIYFQEPQEIMADLLGGVNRDCHTPEAIQQGKEYFEKLFLHRWGKKPFGLRDSVVP